MKTQKQLLEDVLSELADLKSMVSRIDGFVAELQAKEKVRQDLEYQTQHRAATLTVDEVMEYEPTSIDLTSEEWRCARDGLKFCIRGQNTADDDDGFECWIIWEFNATPQILLSVYSVMLDEDRTEVEIEREYIYQGKVQKYMLKEHD
jgi:uncharacterized protein YdaL